MMPAVSGEHQEVHQPHHLEAFSGTSSSKAVPLYPRGYDRLPEAVPQRRDTFSVKNAAFRAQIEHQAEIVCHELRNAEAGRDDDGAAPAAGELQRRRSGDSRGHHFRRILLSKGCALLSTLLVVTCLSVTAQQLIERHDFEAVRWLCFFSAELGVLQRGVAGPSLDFCFHHGAGMSLLAFSRHGRRMHGTPPPPPPSRPPSSSSQVLVAAGIFSCATVLVAFGEIMQHCIYYTRPSLQKQVCPC